MFVVVVPCRAGGAVGGAVVRSLPLFVRCRLMVVLVLIVDLPHGGDGGTFVDEPFVDERSLPFVPLNEWWNGGAMRCVELFIVNGSVLFWSYELMLMVVIVMVIVDVDEVCPDELSGVIVI